LLAIELEGDAKLDERLDFTLSRENSVSGRRDVAQMAGADGGESDAAWTLHVDDAPAREVAFDRARRFLLDLRPGRVRYRGQLAVKVVHEAGSPLREPIPSEPSRFATGCAVARAGVSETVCSAGAASSPTFSRNVADGTKNRLPVCATLKSS